ncbi:hypothetical protein [Streptomyces sp. NPDC055692]|uniref:hypothetical protein n=1 Tax=Streptomyces sp. NPDC055692 TaxID=3155683 RepID=UPI0034430211
MIGYTTKRDAITWADEVSGKGTAGQRSARTGSGGLELVLRVGGASALCAL